MGIDFTGPLGGILAAAYGAGAVMGWGFAQKTIGKRITELKSDVEKSEAGCDRKMAEMKLDYERRHSDLSTRLREIEDRAWYGSQRQLGQIHDSSVHLLDRGTIKPPLGEEG